jgi:hypothetical protein
VTLRTLLPLKRFVPRLRIKTKAGPVAPLRMRPEQEEVLHALETGEDLIILKPRQIGCSTIIAAYLLWIWLTSPHPITIVVLSYKQKSAKHLMKMITGMYRKLPEPLRLPLSVDNQDHCVLEGSGAEIMAVGAQDDEGTRSFTAHYVWLSEFAFMPKADELMAAAVGSLTDDGQMIAESTANHWNDALHQEIQKVQRGESDNKFLFFPWKRHAMYRTKDTVRPSPEEEEWMREHGLDTAQLAWWRRKVRKLGEGKARREFPLSISDAYAQGAGSFLTDEDLSRLTIHQGNAEGTTRYEVYNPRYAYGSGFDPGGGVGLDASSLTIYNYTLGTVAATWRMRTHTTEEALTTMGLLCTEYNALLAIEYNNHGHTYVEAILSLGVGVQGLELWLDPHTRKPWTANKKTRGLLWGNLKRAIQNGEVTGVDQITESDLRQVQEDDQGNIILPHTAAGHCDSAVSLALAVMAGKSARPRQGHSLETVLSTLKAQKFRQQSQQLRRY